MRTRRQWAEYHNERAVLAECQELVDAGIASWVEPELLTAVEVLGLAQEAVVPVFAGGREWLAVAMSPPKQLVLEGL
jgi:hypothetical protein